MLIAKDKLTSLLVTCKLTGHYWPLTFVFMVSDHVNAVHDYCRILGVPCVELNWSRKAPVWSRFGVSLIDAQKLAEYLDSLFVEYEVEI